MGSLETLTPGQLLRLTQIELRCVQECTMLFETTVPECVCEIVQQHAMTAHRVSEIHLLISQVVRSARRKKIKIRSF